MKRFIFKAAGFLVLGFLILNFFGYLLIHSDGLSKLLSWGPVLAVVEKSKRAMPPGSTVLILGDSVGNQFFPAHMFPVSLAANGSVLAAGHYILAHNAIKRNKQLKYVVLLSVPFVIGHQFARSRTYNNFMKPFYRFENLRYISDQLQEKINKRIMARLVLFPFVKTAPCFSDIDFSTGTEKPAYILSDTAIEYLKKLQTLCRNNGIDLIVVSPPIQERWGKITKNWEKMKAQIVQNGLDDIFKTYFNRIIYLDNNNFMDHVHLQWDYLNKNRAALISRMLPKEVLDSLFRPKN